MTKWMVLPAVGGAMLLAACTGYGGGGVVVGAQLGPSIDLYGYSAERDGDWHAGYRQWSPTTVYEVNGQYYPNSVKGARQVQVYHTSTGYVLPPRDKDWAATEKRFDKKKVPTDVDYSRAHPRP